MALNLRRWVLAAVAGFALILLAYRPGEEEARPAWWNDRFALPTPEQRRLNELGSALQRARSELFLAEQRDTLLQGLAIRHPRTRIDSMLAISARLSPNAGGARLEVMFPLAPERRRALDEAFASAWRIVGPGDSSVRVVAALFDRYGLDLYVLPDATDGRTCIAGLPLNWELRRLVRTGDEPPPQELLVAFFKDGLGPCAYYAAFGRPGPAIERWLELRRFDLAGRFDWDPRDDSALAIPVVQAFQTAIAPQFDGRFSASFDALGCAAGDQTACRKALFQPAVGGRADRRSLPGVILASGRFIDSRGFYGGDSYLTDLVREMGRDRFGRFWRSTLAPDSAFADAFDQPIERWTARWEKQRLRGMVLRNRISPIALLLSVLLVAAVIAGGTLVATRRTVG